MSASDELKALLAEFLPDLKAGIQEAMSSYVASEAPSGDQTPVVDKPPLKDDGSKSIVPRFLDVAAAKAAASAIIDALDPEDPETGDICVYIIRVAHDPRIMLNDIAVADKKEDDKRTLRQKLLGLWSKVRTFVVMCAGTGAIFLVSILIKLVTG